MASLSPRVRPVLNRVLLSLVCVGLVATGCTTPGQASAGPGSQAPNGRLDVVASTTVLADLVANVAGDRATVTSILPAGGEVHTFEPTPSDASRMADADLVVINGLGLDEWAADLARDSGGSATVVELAEDLEGVTYLEGGHHEDEHDEGEHEADDDHAGESVNPHLWLNVAYAQRYVERIAEALAETDPDHADAYRQAAADYDGRLGALDAEIRDRLAALPEEARLVVSFHEAWPYFADAYGLEIVGTVVDAPGQDPSAGEIADLVEAIRGSGARAVFAEAQFSPDLARTVADEAGVPVVSDLYNDSLGEAPVDSYEAMMRWNIDRTMEALEQR